MTNQKPMRGIQLNRTHPLSRGLVACYLFNEITGETVFDLSNNGNNGTLENGVAWGGGGLEFDGGDDYVELPTNAELYGTNGFTLEVQFNSNDYGIDFPIYRGTFYSTRASTANGFSIWLDNENGDKKITLQNRESAGGTVETGNGVWSVGTQHHLSVTHDGNTQKIYVDGVLKATGNNTWAFQQGDLAPTIGMEKTLYIYNGSIGYVRIYNRALSAGEITWSYREPYAMFEPAFNPALLYSAAPPVGAMWYYNMLRRRNR